ncbi:MAG: AMIN domain-containing protein, partial [Desulfurivibrionaceae bacterium]
MTPLITRLKCISAGLMIFCFLASGTVFAKKTSPPSPQTKGTYLISGISLNKKAADTLQLVIQGQTPPTYTMYELFDPLRIVLDIADAKLSDSAGFPENLPQGPVLNIKKIAMADQSPAIARLEIYLSGDPAYTIERQGDNIVVTFAKTIVPPQLASPPAVEEEPQALPIVSPSSQPASVLNDIEIDTTNPTETRVFIKTDGQIID